MQASNDPYSSFHAAYSHLSSRTLFTMLAWEQTYPGQTERWRVVRDLLGTPRFISRRTRRDHYVEIEL